MKFWKKLGWIRKYKYKNKQRMTSFVRTPYLRLRKWDFWDLKDIKIDLPIEYSTEPVSPNKMIITFRNAEVERKK